MDWLNSPVGKALTRFETAVVRAWVMDTEDSFNDKDRKATKEAHADVKRCRDELKAEIVKLDEKAA
jgi:hypothetical protein